MATQTRLMTADDLLHLPDDGFRYELVRGELQKMAPPGDEHGTITMNIAGPLDHYVRTQRLGRVYAAETGFRIASNPDTVLAPDVAFIRQERLEAEARVRGYRAGAPDLVAEVISPSDLYTEVAEKVEAWLAAGTQLVIIVDPRRQTLALHRSPTEMQTLTINDTLDGGPVVPGWTLPVRDVFV
jgi:Uma2 family endonuclease